MSLQPRQTHLTDPERRIINGLFARTWKKYMAGATDHSAVMEINTPLTMDEARSVARTEFETANMLRIEQTHNRLDNQIARQHDRRRIVAERHNARIAQINTDAQKRGIANSTIVLNQLQRAVAEKNRQDETIDREIETIQRTRTNDIARFTANTENRIEALAKRIHADSLRTNVAVVRERSAASSRSHRDMVHFHTARMSVNMNVNQLIDDELHGQYMHWLFTNKTPADARSLAENEPIFMWGFVNTSSATRFRNEVMRRWHT